MTIKLYLASNSPRRAVLLNQLNLVFETLDVAIDESPSPGESAQAFVERMALEKAQAGFSLLSDLKSWVIGGDTLLNFQGRIIGKPACYQDFVETMRLLSGQWHEVLSSVALVNQNGHQIKLNKTRVKLKHMSDYDLASYWQTGEPMGKAGGYAIQGLGCRYIERIDGSYSAVMGLPLFELNQLLIESGFYE